MNEFHEKYEDIFSVEFSRGYLTAWSSIGAKGFSSPPIEKIDFLMCSVFFRSRHCNENKWTAYSKQAEVKLTLRDGTC